MPACGQGLGNNTARQSRRSFAPSLLERAPLPPPSSRCAAAGEWRRRRRAGAVAASASPAAAAPQQQQQPAPPTADPATTTMMHPAESESLRLLEWPALCRQVARLCGSSLGAERALSAAGLPLGRSREESALLLQQTAEAMLAGGAEEEEASSQGKKGQGSKRQQQRKSGGNGGSGGGGGSGLRVRGVLDLRPVLDACERDGLCLTARQLEGVAATLEAAYAAKAQAEEEAEEQAGGGGRPRFPALAALAASIDPSERPLLLQPIRAAISSGAVADSASPELAAVRAERRDNMAKTRALVADAAKKLFASGASEVREPVVARGRLAVSVRAGQSGAVPGGAGVRLGQSSTGATLYVEPKGAVAGNNREAELAQREADEELKVLRGLSRAVAARARARRALLGACAELDVVAARAAHARWCGGIRPEFVVDEGQDQPPPAPIDVRALRHPLLLEPSLALLPPPPAAEDDALFAAAADAAAAAAMVAAGSPSSPAAAPAINVSPQGVPSWGLGLPGVPGAITKGNSSSGSDGDGSDGSDGDSSSSKRAPRAAPPKPIDFVVPPGARVVAITGPNTGGKTATLKAAGLAVLMAKAGMFLPLLPTTEEGEEAAAATAGQPTTAATTATPPPRLLWFDRVLADIGDAQSLQQSLSTFGGHVKRLKGVLSAATSGSLVLLDEVGSGTDPQEGAALARAVLDRLAASARLTVGTTHHAELRAAADEDARYTQAAMGFDASTLKPTYALLWGRTGASCALDVAESLGFDGGVVQEARRLAAAAEREEKEGVMRGVVGLGGGGREEAEGGGAAATTMAGVAAGVEAEIAAAERQLAARRAERESREAEVSRLRALTAELMRVRRTLQGESDALLRREAAGMALRLHDRLKAARRAPVGGVAGAAAGAAGAAGNKRQQQPAELRELEREFSRWESLVRARVEAEYGPGGFVGRIGEGEGEGGEGDEDAGGAPAAALALSAAKKPTSSSSSSSSSDPPIRVGDYVHVTRLGSLGYGRVTRVSRAGGGGKKGGGGGGGAGGDVQLRVRTALMGMEARARLDEVLRLPGPPTAGSAADAEAALAAARAAAEEERERARRQQEEEARGGGREEDEEDAPGAGAEAVGVLPGMGAGEAALLMRVDDALSSSSSAGAAGAAAAAPLLPPPAPATATNTADVSSEPSAELAAGAALDALDEAAASIDASSSAPGCLYVRVGRDRALRAAVRAAIEAAAAEDEDDDEDGGGGWRLAAPLTDVPAEEAILVRFYASSSS
jgi:DNA mismatch repair protein MutS2